MQDYSKLGLRCGIEIHQQLDTHKLFCECPSRIRDDEPHGAVRRKIRAVAGEMGDVDPAALHELLKDREFAYEYYIDSTCLVELDEEPPHELNDEALDIVLEAALLLNAKPVDEIQIMRKTVIDGSNTSGFQRTVLVATDGHIEVGGKRVSIPTICLEEDAARIISREGNITRYRLDRLGIPLIEIGTDPDITSPEEAKKVAEKIGMLLRATGRVKRGLGTIRQDVNVSIKGGRRIEIKGVQALNDIPGLVENEVSRQSALIEIKKELGKRGFRGFKPDVVDVSSLFRDSQSKIVKGKSVFGIKVPKFAGLVGKELMPQYRFGTELAGIAKVVAGLKGIFHSDELPAYGIDEKEVSAVRKILKPSGQDAFILAAADEARAKKAFDAIAKRCNEALDGVPKEVRRADGTVTRFMRPLPGSARMYPETDEPVVRIGKVLLDSIELSKTPEEQLAELKRMGLGGELANQLVHSRVLGDFKELNDKMGLKPSVVASALLAAPEGINVGEALALIDSGKVAKESLDEIMQGMKKGKPAEKVAEEKGLFLMSDAEVKKKVKEIIASNKGANFGQLMGMAMSQLRGKAKADRVKKLIEGLS
jgi:glutamyl-tRNA(Gln) amidotransferase subunit E